MRLASLGYYGEKLKRAAADGTLRARVARKARATVATRLGVLARYARLSAQDRRLPLAQGFADHRDRCALDSRREEEILDRLVRAYRAARADQRNAPAPFQLRGLWAEWIDLAYGPLIAALRSDDRARLAALLRNFCRESFAVGVASSHGDYARYTTSLFGGVYVRATWCDYRDRLLDAGYDLSRLTHPLVGNPAGVPMNGCVIPVEALRYAYNAFTITNLLCDVPGAVVMEIGGGYGDQAFHTVEHCRRGNAPVARYLNFDIPEVLLVAGYFLLAAWPHARIRLYGEGPVAPWDESFDVGLFPHFTVDQVPDASVDLVFNTNSFAEMDESASRHYLGVVNRVCRRYFMHVNHDVPLVFRQPDGTTSRNAAGSSLVPDEARFKRLYKRPRLYGRPEDRPYKAFAYLYERRRDPAPG